MTEHQGKQYFTPTDGKLPREYFVYRRLPNHRLDYLGTTIGVNASEALKSVLRDSYRADFADAELDVNELDEGLWQMWLGSGEYIVKSK